MRKLIALLGLLALVAVANNAQAQTTAETKIDVELTIASFCNIWNEGPTPIPLSITGGGHAATGLGWFGAGANFDFQVKGEFELLSAYADKGWTTQFAHMAYPTGTAGEDVRLYDAGTHNHALGTENTFYIALGGVALEDGIIETATKIGDVVLTVTEQ